MSFNTFKHYGRELMSISDDFYAVSLRSLRRNDEDLLQVRRPPPKAMRWGERIPDLEFEGPASLQYPEDAIPVGLSVNGDRLFLMFEENNDERKRCDQQIRFDEIHEPIKVRLSTVNSMADLSEVEVELTGQSGGGTKVIIREQRAGKLISEMHLNRFPGGGGGYLEIMEFGTL